MSLFDKLFAASGNVFMRDDAWTPTIMGSVPTEAGVSMSPDKATGVSSYFACMRALSEDIGKLPLVTYERVSDTERQRAPDHPVYRLLHDSPNEDMTAQAFRETLTAHAGGYGGGFAEIERDGRGRPVALHMIHPTRMTITRDKDGQLFYVVRNNHGVEGVPIDPRDMFHLHGVGDDGISGYSIARLAAQSLGLARATEQFGASFFRNGAALSGLLVHPAELSDEAIRRMRESWRASYQGASNAGSIAVLDEGVKYEKIGIPPEDAQFLETRNFSVEEICRWWRVPPVKVGHNTSTPYTNIESLSRNYVDDTLMPWAVRWEQEAQRKLFTPQERGRYFVKHSFNALLRGDTAARGEFYVKGINNGWFSPNEVRMLEDMNPREGGDEYFMPLNMQGSQSGDDPANSVAESVPSTLGADIVASVDSAGGDDIPAFVVRSKAVMHSVLAHACGRVLGIEEKAVSRAAAKYGTDANAFGQWAIDFYGKQAERFAAELVPPCESLYLLVGGGDVAGLEACVATVAAEHVSESLTLATRDSSAFVSSVGSVTTASQMAERIADRVVGLAMESNNDPNE